MSRQDEDSEVVPVDRLLGCADTTDVAVAELRKRRRRAKSEGTELTDYGIFYAVMEGAVRAARRP